MNELRTELLGQIANIRRGITYSEVTLRDSPEDGLPYINMKSFLKDGGYNQFGLKYYAGFYTAADIANYCDLLIANTDVTRDGDIIGVPALLPDELQKNGALFSHHVTRLVVGTRLSVKYLYYLLCTDEYRRAMKKYARGTTVLMLDMNGIKRIPICYRVSRAKQEKVVDILEAVDANIEKTQKLIVKYQQIKAGLMHDLFTRGVLPNGQLRPSREQEPELYKETAIGWIPREWDLQRCADLCTRICVGIVIQPTQYYVEEGVPAFRSANVREVGIDPSNLVYISAVSNQLLAKSQVKAGDIVSVRTGYPGTSAIISPEFEGANCIDILISTPGDKINSEYLCYWINSSFGKGQVLRQQGGMAQQHFNVGEMRELLVALPNADEQIKIRDKIDAVASKLAIERAFLEKLRTQKLGLMHDLLTDKVKVDTPERDDARQVARLPQ
ncbi:hypothetical protein PHLH5_07240 [Pseudomonas sp. Cab53]|uniref:restriction endonuclease subunit S n=1 Tax=Pseudomonas sp. Cab53 TaxID=2678258 RepID=UPI001BB2FA1C|nr:restriction endonuclease subunit S [Pseudomonas sp. Cab53]BBP63183.1 hypothetical protein PHLH5_07240 [Pseudomonas sp. Cab53]